MKKLFIIYFLLCLACKNNNSVQVPIHSEADLSIESIQLDTLFLEKEYFSGVGFFTMGKNQLFFVDQIFSTVISYASNGSYLNTFLGKGDGPDEQNNIHGFQPFFYNDQHVVLDNFEFVVFDNDFQKIRSLPIKWNFSESHKDMVNKPKGDMLGIYELDWKPKGYNTSFFISEKHDEILVPITTSHPMLNAYQSEDYYRDVFVLGKYDIQNQEIFKGIGFRSSIYLDYSFIPNFDFSFISQSQNHLFISYAIDPLIHVFDFDGNLLYKFGKEGLGFKNSYPKTQSIEEALDNHQSDMYKAGYYHFLYHDETNNLTFRTYYPSGSKPGKTRLQIYKESKLIGDVDVPDRFRVIGRIGEYYFVDGIVDELNDRIAVLKFKL